MQEENFQGKIIDGKAVAARIRGEIKDEVKKIKDYGVLPCLAVIIAGNNPASRVYVNNKKKACAEVGIESMEFALPDNVMEDELISLIDRLNADESVDGILYSFAFGAY